MTLPPERITIKRRREDEPVEALYIEQKRHCSNNTYWLRVSDERSSGNSATISPRGYLHSGTWSNNQKQRAEAGVPEIKESLPIKETTFKPPYSSEQVAQVAQNGTQDAQGAARSSNFSTRPIPPKEGKAVHETKQSGTQPRTFYLSATTKSLSSPSMASMHGVKKSRRRRHDWAVFEEKIKVAIDPRAVKAETQTGTDLLGQGTGVPGGVERKHPNLRVQPAVSSGGAIPTTEYLPEAPDRDETIPRPQQIDEVTDCLSQATLQAKQAQQIIDSQMQPQLKFQPKPPKPRCKENRLSATGLSPTEVLPDAQNSESQDDFVYDTYLRTKQQPIVGHHHPDHPMNIDHQLESLADGKVGILVIAEQDEAVWEKFAEDEESDNNKDWNSEDEDENAEDFYGNDYPEDEVASDDEYGRDAYRYYRRHASDADDDDVDEEFEDGNRNNGNNYWSNDDEEDKEDSRAVAANANSNSNSWKHNNEF